MAASALCHFAWFRPVVTKLLFELLDPLWAGDDSLAFALGLEADNATVFADTFGDPTTDRVDVN